MSQQSQEMGRASHRIWSRALEILHRKMVPQKEQEIPRFWNRWNKDREKPAGAGKETPQERNHINSGVFKRLV